MADISFLNLHDPNDAVSHHLNHRLPLPNPHRRGETFTDILYSIPCSLHTDDLDLYASETERPSASVLSGDVSVSDSVVTASEGLEFLDRLTFVMDLFYQRVEQSQVTPHDDIDDNEVAELRYELGSGVSGHNFGVAMGNFELDSELESESGDEIVVQDIVDRDIDASDDLNPHDYDDFDFHVERRPFSLESRGTPSIQNDFRIVAIDLGSDDEDEDSLENENERDLWGIDINEDDVYVSNGDDDEDDASVTVPLCWDSLQLEEGEVTDEEFEWEEVDGCIFPERGTFSVSPFPDDDYIDDDDDIDDDSDEDDDVNDSDEDDDVNDSDDDDDDDVNDSDDDNSVVVPIITLEDLANGESTEHLGNLGWEVLLNSRNLETNSGFEGNGDRYLGDDLDDYIHTMDYDMMLEQFAEAEISIVGQPPTSKAFVKNLPSIVVTNEDAEKDHLLCAICKEDMNVGNKAARLPCSHMYHSDCIHPWLGIKNTCPVCRYELPTDDAEYERRKSLREVGGTTHLL